MSAFRLATSELRRLTAGKLPKLAVLAVTLVPLLYGALYLYANWDPYGKLKEVPAAIVVEDAGFTTSDGTELRAGQKVAEKLDGSAAFDWNRVSAQEAEAGVRDGRYTFSLTLPKDFSEALASPAKFEARQGTIVMTTNDANNYLVGTIADKVVGEVRRAVAADAGAEAADKLLLGFATLREKTQQAAEGAGKLADGSAKARDGAGTLADKTGELADGVAKLRDGAGTLAQKNGELATGLGTMREQTKDLPAKSAQLADGAKQAAAGAKQTADGAKQLNEGAKKVADGNEQLAEKAETIAGAAQQFVDKLTGTRADIVKRLQELGLNEEQIGRVIAVLDQVGKPVHQANDKIQGVAGQVRTLADGAKQVSTGLGKLVDGTGQLASGTAQVADGAGQLAAKTPELAGAVGKAADGAKQLADGAGTLRDKLGTANEGAGKLASGARDLRDGVKQVADGSAELHTKLADGVGQIPNPNDDARKNTAKTIGDPVAVRAVGENKAGSYGAGLAPFFLGLALWIGAFVLFLLLRPLSRRALAASQPALRVALGGWLPAALLGAAQSVLLFAVVTLAIGVDPARPVATMGFLLLTSLAFTAVLHGLNALLGPSGKFVALVLLVLQLTTAGGTFPWQTTPEPLHPLHLALPLSYVVDGLRHLLYGGDLANVGVDVAVLGSYLVVGLLLSVFAAYKQRVWTPSRLKPELVL